MRVLVYNNILVYTPQISLRETGSDRVSSLRSELRPMGLLFLSYDIHQTCSALVKKTLNGDKWPSHKSGSTSRIDSIIASFLSVIGLYIDIS